jgi:hypothetical protein
MAKMPRQKPTESKQDYGTPKDFLKAVEERFGVITFDLAAHKGNNVCPNYFAPRHLEATYLHGKTDAGELVKSMVNAGADKEEAITAFWMAKGYCEAQNLKKYKISVYNYDTGHKGFDSLNQNWNDIPKDGGIWWLNPEYSNIDPWANKCYETTKGSSYPTIAFLIPASVGTNYFFDYIDGKAAVKFLNPRLSFDGIAPYPKDLLLAVYGLEPGYECWKWK